MLLEDSMIGFVAQYNETFKFLQSRSRNCSQATIMVQSMQSLINILKKQYKLES